MVRAIRNELKKVLDNEGGVSFDGLFGAGAREALTTFAPGAENDECRETMKQEFLKLRNQEDPYTSKYMRDPPDSLSYEDARKAEKKLTMENVVTWVERFDRHCGRLRFFADLTPTPYFQLVAKPLLSIKTTGSISVERAAKPLKIKLQPRNAIVSTQISVFCCYALD
jgi:hypothetical protein